MPKAYPYINTFNAGEVSELIFNREDISKYKSACRTLENSVPLVEGGTKKMPGTYYAAGGATPNPCRVVPFQFSTTQGAILWIINNAFYGGTAIAVFVPATPGSWTLVNVATITGLPYLQNELFELDCSTQSADVLWIFHPNHPPACVEQLSPTNWVYTLSPPGGQYNEPPYRGTSDIIGVGFSGIGTSIADITQANPCAVSLAEAIGVTEGERIYINGCSGMVELNEGEFFIASSGGYTDVINLTPADGGAVVTGAISGTTLTVTLIHGGAISVGMLLAGTGVTSGTTVTAFLGGVGGLGTYTVSPTQSVGSTLITTPLVDSTKWLTYTGGGFIVPVVALFNTTGNYPACGTFYQQRLWLAGTDDNPTTLWGSVQGDYPDFICDSTQDDYAVQFTLVSTLLDQILNLIGSPNALIVGTAGGIWAISSPGGTSISQVSVNAAKQSTLGVARLQPQLVGDSAIFVSRSAKTVTFLTYNFVSNQWDNTDLTRLNRQITIGTDAASSGIIQTAFQSEPYPIFWAVRADGQLLGLVFNKQDQVYAWFRVNMLSEGGKVESVAVITGQNQEDMVVISVQRTINGAVGRYLEYFMPQELFGQLSNAFFVHCGLQLNLGPAVAITAISNTNPPTVTAPGQTFVNGTFVQIANVLGMVEINQDKTEAYTVINTDYVAGTFQLQGMDTTAFGVYTSGGTALPVTNVVTGMYYLLGQTVIAVGDGAKILPPTIVTSDSLTFPYYCNQITVGLPYSTTIQPVNPVLSSAGNTTRGMKQKLNRATLSLYQSMGGQFGTDLNHMYPIVYGPGTMGQQPAMSTFEITRDLDADWDDESTFYIVQDEPFPFTLRGLVMRMSYNQD
jgi:hypothetical protein